MKSITRSRIRESISFTSINLYSTMRDDAAEEILWGTILQKEYEDNAIGNDVAEGKCYGRENAAEGTILWVKCGKERCYEENCGGNSHYV